MALETQITELFLKKVILSLLVGALLGLEREYTKDQEIVGLRTFSLISLLGGFGVIISQSITNNFLPFLIGLISICGFSIFLYWSGIEKNLKPGFTTNIALILSYLLGATAGYGLFLESIFLSVVIVIVLYSRERLHKIIDKMSEKEAMDLFEFIVVLGIIYPLLPSQPPNIMGITIPLKTVWFLIVIISLINFFSFIGSRFLKSKYEIPLISFLGGLISSSGVSASLATQFNDNRDLKNTIASGFLLTTAALLVKNLGMAIIFNPNSLKYLTIPLILGVIPLAALAYYKSDKHDEKSTLDIESPFHIEKAAKFGVAILSLIIIIEIFKDISSGLVLLTAFVAGTLSSTSMTLSLISLSLGGTIMLPTFLVGVVLATIGSYIGDYMILYVGNAKEIIQSTWKEIILSMLVLSITFILIYLNIGA